MEAQAEDGRCSMIEILPVQMSWFPAQWGVAVCAVLLEDTLMCTRFFVTVLANLRNALHQPIHMAPRTISVGMSALQRVSRGGMIEAAHTVDAIVADLAVRAGFDLVAGHEISVGLCVAI